MTLVALALVFAFTGNDHISTGVLRAQLADEAAAGGTDRDALDHDAAVVMSYYDNDGYLTAKATASASGDVVTIAIAEGSRFTLGAVHVTKDLLGTEAENLAIAHLPVGAPYVRDPVAAGIAALQRSYHDRGYAKATVTPLMKIDSATRRIDMTLEVDRGALYTIGAIAVHGAAKTGEAAVRKALLFKPGQKFSETTQDQTRQKLVATGAYRDVTLRATDDGAGHIDIAVELVER